jgi:hypothetical protein
MVAHGVPVAVAAGGQVAQQQAQQHEAGRVGPLQVIGHDQAARPGRGREETDRALQGQPVAGLLIQAVDGGAGRCRGAGHQGPAAQRQQAQEPAGQPSAERAECYLLAVKLHREPAEQPDPDHRRIAWQPLARSALPGRSACRGTLAGAERATLGCLPVMTVMAGSPARQARV